MRCRIHGRSIRVKHFELRPLRREDDPPLVSPIADHSLTLARCLLCQNAERDPLLFHRELSDDYAVPDWSGGDDHAQNTTEGHQHLQRGT